MAETLSTMLPLGVRAPDFSLPDSSGNMVSLGDLPVSSGLLVMFICNHCPYVKHVAPELARLGIEYPPKGIAIVAISANDAERYPDDGPAKMAEESAKRGYAFPYLYDKSQSTAKAYRAACTPDFFLFDQDCRLVYRGQLDESRPGNGVPVTGADLRRAMDQLISGATMASRQRPSLGCNIKWRPGNEPDYARPS